MYRITPALSLIGALLIALASALTAIYLALHQPWLGLDLATDPSGDTILIGATSASGPNGALPPGNRIIAISTGAAGVGIPLVGTDIVEEPDTFDTFGELDGFFRRQGQLHDMLSNGAVVAEMETGDQVRVRSELNVAPRRAFTDLPAVFWVQIFVGMVGFLIGAWVWSLQRSELSAFFFALAGFGLMIAAIPAAIYSARELALAETLFRVLSNLNNTGSLTFGAGMIGLFLRYPRPLSRKAYAFLPALILGAWVGSDWLRLLSGPPLSRHLPIVLALTAIAVCVAAQFLVTRGDPRARAILRWLGLSVLTGAGLFVLTIIVPELFGATKAMSQGYSFLFFLIIYAGVALGVSRYRLFNLEEWAFRILFYMAGILLIVLFDAAIVILVSAKNLPAFSLSFIIVALLYLPFRDSLWRHFVSQNDQSREVLFSRIVDIALTPPGKDQSTRWQELLAALFEPLRMQPMENSASAGIIKDGLGLIVPAVGGMSAQRLEYAKQGRKLFNPHDVRLVSELASMLDHALQSRHAFEQGVTEERTRIARDMHDNIGAQLLGALHSRNAESKDAMIRESLSDLRDIINNLSQSGLSLEEVLADLRAETADRFSNADIVLDWQLSDDAPVSLSPSSAHALRSFLREAVSNIIRHSGAGHATIATARENGLVTLVVADDGKGFDLEKGRQGNGLDNMKARIQSLGGAVKMTSSPAGTRIEAGIPMNATEDRA